MNSGPRIPRLMLVSDRHRFPGSFPDLAALAVAGGVDAVQLREPDLLPQEMVAVALLLARGAGLAVPVLVNGSFAVAARFGFGIHLPEAGPAVAEARRAAGEGTLVGRSVHSPAAARGAGGADYLLVGNVFPTGSKPGQPPLGLDGLNAIANATPIPVLAVGGIDETNAGDVLAAGAHGIAVVAAIAGSADPTGAARRLRAIVDAVPAD